MGWTFYGVGGMGSVVGVVYGFLGGFWCCVLGVGLGVFLLGSPLGLPGFSGFDCWLWFGWVVLTGLYVS